MIYLFLDDEDWNAYVLSRFENIFDDFKIVLI